MGREGEEEIWRGIPRPESVIDDAFVASHMRVEFPNGEDGEPVVTIDPEVVEIMNGLWKQSMIVKVLGRHVLIAALSRKLRELWKPKGGMYVLDLPRQFFIVRFDDEEDYFEAMTGGPWRLFGSVLMAQAWSPEFNPMTDEISTTPVWVRISNVPFTFYHRQILMGMVVGLGKPLRVDGTTLQFERARFARICIEVDLKKPLKGSILINRERSYVSYEGLNNICSTCGVYGHLITACPQTVAESMEQVNITMQPSESTGGVQGDDGFTVVRRSNRRAGGPTNKNAVNVSQVGNVQKRNTRVNAPIPDHGNVAVFQWVDCGFDGEGE